MSHPIRSKSVIFFAILFCCSAAAEEDCNMHCMAEKLYDEYEAADLKLNITYKRLAGLLNKAQKKELKEIELRWISRMDEVCDEIEERSCGPCTNGWQIIGSAIDKSSCKIEFTNTRLKELLKAEQSIKARAIPEFGFREPKID